MGPLGVIERHPVADHAPCLEPVADFLEIDGFLFQGSPQALDEDVVHAPTAPIHRHPNACLSQRGDPGRSGELRSLIGVHDLGRPEAGDGVLKCLYAEVRVHRIAEPPVQHLARGPVHDRDQIQEAALHRDEGDIGTPDLVRPVDDHAPQ